jgi:hypothetical protein
VDAVYGNDTAAAASRYTTAFLTITAALALAASGENVIVNAGVYNESITIPDGVSLTGAGSQCVRIQKLGVTAITTLITMNMNARIENITGTLTSSGNYYLTGIEILTGASVNAKVRNCVLNVTSTTVDGPTIIGLRSAGSSALTVSTSNLLARSTINVVSSSSGITRGILVNGDNLLTIRESVVGATGAGTDIIGVESTNASAKVTLKSSTIGGVKADISRTLGYMLIGYTDLVNNSANTYGFDVTQEPHQAIFGFTGNPDTGTRYLFPSILVIGDLPTTAYTITSTQNMVLFQGSVKMTGITLTGVQTLSVHVHKNGNLVTPVFSIVMGAGETYKYSTMTSVDFKTGDTYHVEFVASFNPGALTFMATFGFF